MCGSGKTTFARRLSERTGIPWISVDDLTWEPGWVTVPDDEQEARIRAICGQEAWILDTAYAKWLPIPLQRVELIVGLDYPRWFSLTRLILRTLRRVTDRQPVCNGNTERWSQALSRDSIILWHFKSWKRKRARIRAWQEDPSICRVIAFRTHVQAEKWLASVGSEASHLEAG